MKMVSWEDTITTIFKNKGGIIMIGIYRLNQKSYLPMLAQRIWSYQNWENVIV